MLPLKYQNEIEKKCIKPPTRLYAPQSPSNHFPIRVCIKAFASRLDALGCPVRVRVCINITVTVKKVCVYLGFRAVFRRNISFVQVLVCRGRR